MKKHVVETIQILYQDDSLDYTPYQDLVGVSHLDVGTADYRNVSLSEEEVYQAVNLMSPVKAPGPDGLHVNFYQWNWSVIKKHVTKLVADIWTQRQRQRLHEVNKVRVILIPKERNPSNIFMFRPISLCNVILKIITKCLTERLKPLMPTLTGPGQVGFITGVIPTIISV